MSPLALQRLLQAMSDSPTCFPVFNPHPCALVISRMEGEDIPGKLSVEQWLECFHSQLIDIDAFLDTARVRRTTGDTLLRDELESRMRKDVDGATTEAEPDVSLLVKRFKDKVLTQAGVGEVVDKLYAAFVGDKDRSSLLSPISPPLPLPSFVFHLFSRHLLHICKLLVRNLPMCMRCRKYGYCCDAEVET